MNNYQISPLIWADDVWELEQAAHPLPWSREVLESCFRPNYINWGVYSDSELLAYVIMHQALDEWTIMNIATQPKFQRRGVAQALLSKVQADASAAEKVLWLEVRASNQAAIRLYQKMGFVEQGQRPNYYPTESSDRETAIIMRWVSPAS